QTAWRLHRKTCLERSGDMSFDEDGLETLIQEMLDGGISEAQREDLLQRVESDETARTMYLRQISTHTALQATLADCLPAEMADDRQDASIDLVSKPEKLRFQTLLTVASIAAAVVLAFALLRQGRTESRESASAKRAQPAVARVVAAVDAKWRDSAPLPGLLLGVGSFHLDAGSVELEFDEGAHVSITAPTAFDLKSVNHLHIRSGNLVAEIPEDALGFSVTTPQSEIVDLGTEFGVVVDDNGQTDVHVIDGLVQVFESRNLGQSFKEGSPTGIKIAAGEARRLSFDSSSTLVALPLSSRQEILGLQKSRALPFRLLRGDIRLRKSVSRTDLKVFASGQNWIDVIPERSGVLLDQDLGVTFQSPGNYRFFQRRDHYVKADTRVDSYLLHFRSSEGETVRGVIKFDRPVLGIIGEAKQLKDSDPIVGLDGVNYPVGSGEFRGLEPLVEGGLNADREKRSGGWALDQVTLSKDMTTLGLSVNVEPKIGVDELRVLIESEK
ncbi:MAG: FecR domain-containing protein, partial [Planctomycetota bacterium]